MAVCVFFILFSINNLNSLVADAATINDVHRVHHRRVHDRHVRDAYKLHNILHMQL